MYLSRKRFTLIPTLILLVGPPALVHSQSELEGPRQLPLTEVESLRSLVSPEQKNADLAGKAERVQQRYPNRQIHIERWIIEDPNGNLVNHGDYKEFDLQGNLIAAGNYELGKKTGNWFKTISLEEMKKLLVGLPEGFHPPFESKADFRKGVLHGEWTCTDKDGKLVFLWHFDEGKRHGESLWFLPNGETVQMLTYDKNRVHGPALTRSRTGAAVDLTFVQGRQLRVDTDYFPRTLPDRRFIKSRKTFLYPSELNLAKHDWDSSSVTFEKVSADEPIPHGPFIVFYSNGQKAAQGTYDRGQRSGEFTWWYSNGQKKTTGHYVDDLEDGPWSWWHENGLRMARGSFVAGKKIDQWSVWNPQGQLVKRVDNPQLLEGRESIAETPEKRSRIRR